MKIDIWLPHVRIAGGTRIVLTYAEGLKQRGHEVALFIPSQHWYSPYIPAPLPWRGKFTIRPNVVRSFRDAALHESDIVLADSWRVAEALQLYGPPQKKLFHLVQHDERLYHGDTLKVGEVYRSPRLTKIVVATWLKKMFEDDFGLTAHLLLNPIDKKQFSPRPRTVNDGTIRVGLLHHTYDWKGTKEGAEAIMEVKKRHPNVRLILFGARKEIVDTPHDEYHYDLPQERLAEFYANLDIYLCPSWDEGFGLPSVEAMACGAALVTYDNGGSRDYAVHEKTALVAERRDIKDLEHQLERLIVDNVLRTRIAEDGKCFVETMPGWDERVKELEGILQKNDFHVPSSL